MVRQNFAARNVAKVLIMSVLIFSSSLSGCKSSTKSQPVDFVERNAVYAVDHGPDRLMLVVEITEDGRLRLNKIETGTISDPGVLSEKIGAILNDRQKAGISLREVVIDPQGKIKSEDLEKLIERLASVKALPIRVVKDNL